MRFDYQNLNDGEPKRHWRNGRCWIKRNESWDKRFGSLQLEWTVPCGHCGWSVTFGGGDSGRDLSFTFAIPFLLTLYVTIENVFSMYPFGTDFDRGHDRQIGFYFYEWALWYQVWVGTMASWSRGAPWCRWWRQGSIHFDDLLLGKRQCETAILEEGLPVEIPMPEGVYHGLARVERRTWKRPRWFAFSRVSTSIDIDGGIPHAGKGENSWDCGDDGLWGCGVEGRSIPKAIGHCVEIVLDKRRRYGMPSPASMEKATR